MDGAFIGALGGLIGVVAGGGVQALQAHFARRAEAESVLRALIAEVEALTRLSHHRQYHLAILQHAEVCKKMIADGRGAEIAPMLIINLSYNYFAAYEALLPRIGMLDPYYADRITRFYTYAKSLLESYQPGSPQQEDMDAFNRLIVFESDLPLIDTMMQLGIHIGGFRERPTPKGIVDPFASVDEVGQDDTKSPGSAPLLPPAIP